VRARGVERRGMGWEVGMILREGAVGGVGAGAVVEREEVVEVAMRELLKSTESEAGV